MVMSSRLKCWTSGAYWTSDENRGHLKKLTIDYRGVNDRVESKSFTIILAIFKKCSKASWSDEGVLGQIVNQIRPWQSWIVNALIFEDILVFKSSIQNEISSSVVDNGVLLDIHQLEQINGKRFSTTRPRWVESNIKCCSATTPIWISSSRWLDYLWRVSLKPNP